jgi:hypothetical protein
MAVTFFMGALISQLLQDRSQSGTGQGARVAMDARMPLTGSVLLPSRFGLVSTTFQEMLNVF